jgi:CRP-like cAMP-binding protein
MSNPVPGAVGQMRDANPLAARLATVTDLSAGDREELDRISFEAREVGPRRNIIREGDRPEYVHLIVEGWAARYKMLPDGGRQITALLIPGDLCDLHVTILGEMDHSIATLSPARVAYIPRARMEALSARPALARAFWWATLVDEAVLRSWIVNVGRRDAYEAIGHLMCELYVRLRTVGLTSDHRFELPLTQEDIADALGLTPVHVNRVLQRMRGEGLIVLKRGSMEILDQPRLERASGFNPNYLHIERRI